MSAHSIASIVLAVVINKETATKSAFTTLVVSAMDPQNTGGHNLVVKRCPWTLTAPEIRRIFNHWGCAVGYHNPIRWTQPKSMNTLTSTKDYGSATNCKRKKVEYDLKN
ncbi:unnamed protein product, partial [Iphiclides podalirius]